MGKQQHKTSNSDIAIIGMACRFPGANDPEQYWSNLANGVNSIREITPDRWDVEKFFSTNIQEPNKSPSKWCGLIDKVDAFDNRFFHISPREASHMDPQQRLLLEETWHCIEDAGVPLARLQEKRTSVHVGFMGADYLQQAVQPEVDTDSYACVGNYECILANRVSYVFNFSGASTAANAACASSVVAMHEARRSLTVGESDYAVASGVNLNLHPWKYISFGKARMLSPDGQCKTFDKEANGYVPGDGVGVLLLQRLEDAVREGNHIYGVIKGSSINHGGKALSVTAPRVEAQLDCILSAYRDAGFSPETVNYVEAHGTGTSLGDPIEVEALTRAFREYTDKRQFCQIGSVKTNIGHLEAAAGVAGVIKVLLMMKHRRIVPTLNIKTINPIIEFENTPFQVALQPAEWKRVKRGAPLRASVSSFGFGGVNSHLLLEEYLPENVQAEEKEPEAKALFALSAKTEGSLRELLAAWSEFARSDRFQETSLADLSRTLLTGREAFTHRYGVVVESKEQLAELLQAATHDIRETAAEQEWSLSIGELAFSGWEEAQQDAGRYPAFQRHLDHAVACLAKVDEDGSLVAGLKQEWTDELAPIGQFVLGHAYAATLLEAGFAPKRVSGRKSGLWVSLALSGMVKPEDILAVLCGKMEWGQVAVSRPVIPFGDPVSGNTIWPFDFDGEHVRLMVEGLHERIAGDSALDFYVDKAKKLYATQHTFRKNLQEWDGVMKQYGLQTAAILEPDVLPDLQSREKLLLLVVLMSSLRKLNQKWMLSEERRVREPGVYELVDLVVDELLSQQHLAALAMQPQADFSAVADDMNERLRKTGFDKRHVFLNGQDQPVRELQDLSAWAAQAAAAEGALSDAGACFAFGSENRLENSLLDLWMQGVNVNWSTLYPDGTFRKAALPVYPFERSKFQLPVAQEARLPEVAALAPQESLHPLLDRNESSLQEQKYAKRLKGSEFFLADHIVGGQKVLPGVAYLEMARAAGTLAAQARVAKLTQIIWARPVAMENSDRAGEQDIWVGLYPNQDVVEYEVFSASPQEERIVHGQGKIVYAEQTESVHERLDLGAIRLSCTIEQQVDDCYRIMRAGGLQHGPALQSIREFRWSGQQALAKLEVPEEVAAGASQFELHPAVFDGVLQTAVILAALSQDSNEGMFLPFTVEEVELVKPWPSVCYVYAEMVQSVSSGLRKFNIALTDEAGEVVARLRQFSLKASKTGESGQAKMVYLQPVWKPMVASAGEAQSGGCVLLFDRGTDVRDEWQNRLGGAAQVVLVQPGEGFRIIGPGHYEIAPGNAADSRQLVASLQENGLVPSGILHMWSLEPQEGELDAGLHSLFHLTKAFMEAKWDVPVRLLFAHGSQPLAAAVGGFAKALRLENPKYQYKTVQLEARGIAALDLLLGEWQWDGAAQVRYEGANRFVKSHDELPEQSEAAWPVRTSGVYLITGGLGGLGRIFAEHLAQRAQARLVLTGRSPLDARGEQVLQNLKNMGAEAVYVQGDVANRADADRLVAEAKVRFGEVNGIVHSAGVLRDSFLLKKTEDDLAVVLAPKVQGTIHLDEATQGEPLDFFVLFSSFVAETGNMGQADYAFANSFMDSFASVREGQVREGKRAGRTVSINWPLWAEGGMQVDGGSEEWMKNKFGLLPMPAQEGVAAFDKAVQSSASQVVVMFGHEPAIKKAFAPERTPAVAPQPKAVEPRSQTQMLDRLKPLTEALVKEALCEATRYPVSHFDANAAFEEYGVDSVMIMDLTGLLERKFGELSKTLFFEYQNIADLAGYFVDNHAAKLTELLGLSEEPEAVVHAEERVEEAPAVVLAAEKPARSRFLQAAGEPLKRIPQEEDDIAVIGVAGRYPMADNVDQFWELLKNGVDAITEIPIERWDTRDTYKEKKGYSKWGGFISDVDKFDPLFFNISPREAEMMDPQERLFLETVYHTIEDAAYTKERLKRAEVGVYVGVMYGQYQLFGAEETLKGNPVAPISLYASIANRVSYYFNFHGPSIALDTMCSSSLTSVHLACESLRRGEIDLAIAGGVNVSIHPQKYAFLSEGKFLSSEGRCRSFGEGGDGYVPGEGVGAVLLKPLKQAVADGDRIYAVIKATSINHGGKTNGYTVPNPNAQGSLISDALKKANIDPRTISYIEAHGTGTSLGDPIEITGLVKAFGEHTKDKQFCSIGSAKSNIGHLESSAGIAGLTKVLLQMKHKQLAPSLHSASLNPNISFEDSPFYVQRHLAPWERPVIVENGREVTYPRRAGLSSFGAGGANAHLIVEEYDQPAAARRATGKEPSLIVLSAKTEDRLRAYAKQLASYLESSIAVKTRQVIDEAGLRELVRSEARKIAADVLQVAEGAVDPEEQILEYGFDPVSIAELAERIAAKFHLQHPVDLQVEQASIATITDLLVKTQKEALVKQYPQYWTDSIEAVEEKIALEDIAHTLMVGREAMEERLAVLVSDVRELIGRLNEYAEGRDGEQVVRGNSKNDRAKYQMMLEGKEGELFLQQLFQQRKQDKLARLWVSGAGIDLTPIAERSGQLISLPGYPFARERYWLPITQGIVRVAEQRQEAASRLHPLIDSNESSLDGISFCKTFGPHDSAYLEGAAGAVQAVSDTALLEMARAAGSLANPKRKLIKLADIVWGAPVSVPGAHEVSIRVQPSGGGADCEISSASGDGQRLIHLQARLAYGETSAAARPDATALANAVNVSLTDAQQAALGQLGLHPAFVDAALQAAAGPKPHMLLSVAEVEIWGATPISGRAWITSTSELLADIVLADDAGQPFASLKGVQLAPTAGSSERVETVLLAKDWQERSAVSDHSTPEGKIAVLVRDETLTMAQHLMQAMPAAQAVIVRIDPAWNDYETGKQAVRDLLEGETSFAGLIDLSDLHDKAVSSCEPSYGKLALLQEMIRNIQLDPFRILHFTKGLQGYSASVPTLAGAETAGLVRMLGAEYRRLRAKTIDIDLPLASAERLREIVLTEWTSQDLVSEICYRNGKRFVPQMSRLEQAQAAPLAIDPEAVIVITGGTRGIGAEVAKHLVQKGARKLVLMGVQSFPPRADWDRILQDAQSNQGLADRLRRIVELEEQGVRVELYAGSLTEKDKLEAYFGDIRSRLGAIGGVIHSAGLVLYENPAFMNKTGAQMQQVFEPKIEGLQVLHEIFQKDPLRFFVLFSSVSGSFPALATGVSDYAAANAFLDYFASFQSSQGHTHYRSVQWPSWKEVGFGEIIAPVYVQMGLTAHTTAEGLDLLDRSMQQAAHSASILPAVVRVGPFDPSVLLHTRQEPKQAPNAVTKAPAKPPVATANAGGSSQQQTVDKLKAMFSAELKIPQDRMDDTTSFGDYGVDSILLTELVKTAEEWLGVKLDPGLFLEYPTLKSLSEYLQPFVAQQQGAEQAHSQEGAVIEAEANAPVEPLAVKQRHALQPLAQRPLAAAPGTTVASNALHPQRIAVIGMACHFPGATDKDAYWRNLTAGRSSIVEVPKSRWDADTLYKPVYEKGKIISKWGGFIEGIEQFDPGYFHLSEEEAPHLDPLVRQFLEVSTQTLRDAGYEKQELSNRKVGVFVGSRMGNFGERVEQPLKSSIIGIGQNFIGAHVSHFFNFKGPNMVVDTACSSSLVSIHLACQSLFSGESEMALAGGVDILLDEKPYLILSEGRALSPDGKCHTFDQKANGFVPGEGCGAVLLKPLGRALADGDRIYAVIEASAVNNDGNTMGITTPNPEAQGEVIREALQRGGLSASSISYIETHGTGTMIGDPIELKALTRIFRETTDEKQFCGVGSVKTNFGHLLSAAGIASFIKVALSVYHQQLPPTLNCETPNPRFAFSESPFYPNTQLREWNRREGVLRAGISAFGFGGTNAHMIIGEGDAQLLRSHVPTRQPLPPVAFNRKRYWLEKTKTRTVQEIPSPRHALPALLEFVEEV